MPRILARRRLLAVGLSITLTAPTTLLIAPAAGATHPTFKELRYRNSGPRVNLTQRALGVRPLTGVYNHKTKKAVRDFQNRRGFDVTGIVNERTWQALENRWEDIRRARLRIDRKYQRVMSVARNQKGDPYVFGADGPGAFDCSGLILFSYRKATGRSLPHSAASQSRLGERVPRRVARPGDLVIFQSGGAVYHAGIYAGHGDLIHASRPGTNVKRDPIWTSRGVYYIRLLPKR